MDQGQHIRKQQLPDSIRLQAHNKIPDDAWEYQTRKSLNDAAYKALEYVPYSSTMPMQSKTDEPKFMWVRTDDRLCILPLAKGMGQS